MAMQNDKDTYVAPVVVDYGSVVAMTGACDGACVDGIGGMNYIE